MGVLKGTEVRFAFMSEQEKMEGPRKRAFQMGPTLREDEEDYRQDQERQRIGVQQGKDRPDERGEGF